jgi:hypothetical protein
MSYKNLGNFTKNFEFCQDFFCNVLQIIVMSYKKDFGRFILTNWNCFCSVCGMEEDICNWLPEEISCVIVNGEKIPVDNVEFLNIEEDIYGRDLMSFMYNGERKQSLVVKKYI